MSHSIKSSTFLNYLEQLFISETIGLVGNSCADEFTQLATLIMTEQNLAIPRTAEEATTLYVTLLDEIENL